MKLSVIVVNYNVKYFCEQCLSSVLAAMKDIETEVIVVDNNSSDDSIAYLRPRFPWVVFIEEKENVGFAKANNRALRQVKGEFILFLNPDTIVPEDAFKNCVGFFEMHDRAGALGVRMIDGAGKFLPESKRSVPTASSSFFKLSGLSSMFPKSKIFNRYSLGSLPEKGVFEIDVVCGAFMMIPKKVLDKTGGFDERFFMYAEDIDLSYRIKNAGFCNYYLGDITIVHFKGESTKKGSLNYVRIFYQAMLLFVHKHYNGKSNWLFKRIVTAGIAVRAFISVLTLPAKKKKSLAVRSVQSAVLVGGDPETKKAEQILLRNNSSAKITRATGRKVFGSHKDKPDTIVFCTGSLSYKEAIRLLDKEKGTSVRWYGKNTGSIVGSDDKNITGEVFY